MSNFPFFVDSAHHSLLTAFFSQLRNNFLYQFLLYLHIIGKIIRFGYKNWILASGDDYPFKVIPYQGTENQKTTGLPGNRLLKVIQHPQMHEVYFQKQKNW